MDLEYDWRPAKAIANLKKHGVSFEEASTCFQDALAVTFPDGKHSDGEWRFLTFGESSKGRILVVSHTEIEPYRMRIISARKVDRAERRVYEEG